MWRSDHRWRQACTRLVAGTAVLVLTGVVPVGRVAASTPLEDCIARKVDAGTQRPVAQAECIKEIGPATPSTRPSSAPSDDQSDDSGDDGGSRSITVTDDGGTSVGALLAVGLGGLVVGAGVTAVLLRRRPTAVTVAPGFAPGAVPAGPPLQPVVGPPPSPFAGPPGVAAPAAPAASADRGPALIVALVDLTDRVNSQALRADIVAALARVGVLQIDIPAGEPFDAGRMRGVGSAPTADPSLVGRVAATDRPGFRDGAQVVRLPDVIVHVAGDGR